MTAGDSFENLSLKRATLTLQMIVACHRLVATAQSEEGLLSGVCASLVDDDHSKFAWIGRPINDRDKTAVPLASEGFADGYLDSLTVRWGDDQYGNGPTGRAIKTARSCINRSVRDNPDFGPWRERAIKFGYESSVAIPCCSSGEVPTLILNVYSATPKAFDHEEIAVLEVFATDLAFGIEHLAVLRAQARGERRLRLALMQTVNAVASALEKRDQYTAGHQRRVAELATAIADRMGWSEQRIEGLRLGCRLHDIGKIAVPSSILSRPGLLSAEEFDLIKTHTTIGWEIVSEASFPWPIKEIVLQHHERLDGSGYPHGLKHDEISPEARIVGVADTVEAMSTHRPYREGLGVDSALEEIERGSGILYDPEVVDTCLTLFREQGFEWARDLDSCRNIVRDLRFSGDGAYPVGTMG